MHEIHVLAISTRRKSKMWEELLKRSVGVGVGGGGGGVHQAPGIGSEP